MPGVTPPRASAVAEVARPAGLTAKQAKIWKQLAPCATARGTLTPETAAGFAVLCDLVERWRTMTDRIDDEGWTFVSMGERKRHPLCGVWQALTVRVEQQMARYGLMGDGKVAGQVQAPANPWAAIVPPART